MGPARRRAPTGHRRFLQSLALLTQRLPTGAVATILSLDVVPRVAVRVVVVHGLLDRMPRCFLHRLISLKSTRYKKRGSGTPLPLHPYLPGRLMRSVSTVRGS